MEYKYTGIILNKRDVGETDRIYTIYTLEGGKVRSLAKGVRKAQAKLAASLENITLADITIIRARGLGKITGSIVENNFSALKGDYKALLEIFATLNIFDKLVDFENPDPEVFQLLKEYLETVNFCVENQFAEKNVLLRMGFLTKLLDVLGYTLRVDVCAACGNQLSQEALYFDSAQGGVLCQNCLQGTQNVLPIKVNTIKLIRLFLQNKVKTFAKISVTRQDCDNVRFVIEDFLRWTL